MKLLQQVLPQHDSCLKLVWQACIAPDSDYHWPALRQAPVSERCQKLLQQVQLVLPEHHLGPCAGLGYLQKVLQQVCVPD